MAEIITNPCGCSVDWHKNHPLQSKINYCPLHAAATELSEVAWALIEYANEAIISGDNSSYIPRELEEKAQTAIARATEKE